MKGLSPNLLLISSFFIAGIVFFIFIPVDLILLSILSAGSFLLLLLFFVRSRKMLFPDYGFLTFIGLFVFLCGGMVQKIHQPENQPRHYLHSIAAENQFIQLILRENLGRSEFSERFYAEVNQIQGKPSIGNVLFRMKPQGGKVTLKEGDIILIKSRFKKLSEPKNPYQFNYADYLRSQDVYREIEVTGQELKRIGRNEGRFWSKISSQREKITSALNESGLKPSQVKLLKALLLGQKNDLKPETFQAFSNAGLVHILAVSGLHIGLILFFLRILLYPLKKLPKGELIQTFLAVGILWVYAALVGFSPSVIRAVTMFSLVGIGLGVGKKSASLNMLALSAIVLLFIDPGYVQQVGFQLSYSAVLAILLFKPKVDKIWTPNNYVLRYFWQIFTVSICAQIGVLPISLYYFHQFAGLFLLGNIVIIPFLGLLLGGGIVAIALALSEALPNWYRIAYGACLDFLRTVVDFLAGQESFVFENIFFTQPMLITALLSILGFGVFLYVKKKWLAFTVILLVFSFQVNYIWGNFKKQQRYQFVVFHQPLHTVIAQFENNIWNIQAEISSDSLQEFYWMRSLPAESGAESIKVDSLKKLYRFQDKVIWRPTENWQKINLMDFDPEILLLTNSPNINLERMLSVYKPERIVADGSNYYSYLNRWRKTCADFGIPFYSTGKKGAFILNGEQENYFVLNELSKFF